MSQLPSFFRIGEPKRFNYQPRYYDEQKEDLQQRIRQIEQEMGVDHGEAYVPRIRKGQMGDLFRRRRKKLQKQSNIRLFVIILILLFISWWLFFR